jgi:tRNA (cytidine32/uridine32-2'-O)-methyltransferase
MSLSGIRIILVNTTHPGNIGGVARAMKNMGLLDLCLVEPARFPHEEADWRAVGAADVLENARLVNTLEEAIGDCQLVIGTSARGRRIPWPVLDPRRCATQALAAAKSGQQVAIVFGREDRGLTNEELQLCNLHLHVPTHEDYTSLNLAMAVQIVAYELRMLVVAEKLPEDPCADWDAPWSSAGNMERFYQHLEETIIEIGFLNPAAPRQLLPRLRRMYGRMRLDEMELNILRGILTDTQKAARN